jgi:hypothetical protein
MKKPKIQSEKEIMRYKRAEERKIIKDKVEMVAEAFEKYFNMQN